MNNGFLSSASPFTKIMFAIFLMLCSLLVFFTAGLLLANPIFGIGFSQFQSSLSDYSSPNSINFLKYLQLLQSIGLFVVPPFMIAYFIQPNGIDYLHLNKKARPSSFYMVILLMIASIPVINFMADINSRLILPHFMVGIEDWMKDTEKTAEKLTDAFLQVKTSSQLLYNILIIAIVPAIGEELTFRGIFQRFFIDWVKNKHWGIFLSAALFSFIHFQFYGFLPRLLLGMLFGYMLVWSGSLWLPILAHFINNVTVVIILWFAQSYSTPGKLENLGAKSNEILWVISCGLIVAFLLVKIYKDERVKSEAY
jgi:uncharacterized protein